MAGLMKNNFKEEVLTELSWIMNAIDDISSKYGIETYEIMLIRYRVQPEEEKAIDKFFTFHVKELDSITDEEVQKEIENNYFKLTNKKWSVSIEVVKKLIQLKREQLGV